MADVKSIYPCSHLAILVKDFDEHVGAAKSITSFFSPSASSSPSAPTPTGMCSDSGTYVASAASSDAASCGQSVSTVGVPLTYASSMSSGIAEAIPPSATPRQRLLSRAHSTSTASSSASTSTDASSARRPRRRNVRSPSTISSYFLVDGDNESDVPGNHCSVGADLTAATAAASNVNTADHSAEYVQASHPAQDVTHSTESPSAEVSANTVRCQQCGEALKNTPAALAQHEDFHFAQRVHAQTNGPGLSAPTSKRAIHSGRRSSKGKRHKKNELRRNTSTSSSASSLLSFFRVGDKT